MASELAGRAWLLFFFFSPSWEKDAGKRHGVPSHLPAPPLPAVGEANLGEQPALLLLPGHPERHSSTVEVLGRLHAHFPPQLIFPAAPQAPLPMAACTSYCALPKR